MGGTWATSQNGVGPVIENNVFEVWNRSGTCYVGSVLMLDHLGSDAASPGLTALNTTYSVGTATTGSAGYYDALVGQDGGAANANALTDPWGNAVAVTAAGIGILSGGATGVGTGSGGAPLVVVTDLMGGAGVDNTRIKVCIRGLVKVACITTEPIAYGDTLYAQSGANVMSTLTPLITAGSRPVGKARGSKLDNQGGTAPAITYANLILCYFNGGDLFGAQFAS